MRKHMEKLSFNTQKHWAEASAWFALTGWVEGQWGAGPGGYKIKHNTDKTDINLIYHQHCFHIMPLRRAHISKALSGQVTRLWSCLCLLLFVALWDQQISLHRRLDSVTATEMSLLLHVARSHFLHIWALLWSLERSCKIQFPSSRGIGAVFVDTQSTLLHQLCSQISCCHLHQPHYATLSWSQGGSNFSSA